MKGRRPFLVFWMGESLHHALYVTSMNAYETGWLVVDAAVEAIGWGERSVTALLGLSVAPIRLLFPS